MTCTVCGNEDVYIRQEVYGIPAILEMTVKEARKSIKSQPKKNGPDVYCTECNHGWSFR